MEMTLNDETYFYVVQIHYFLMSGENRTRKKEVKRLQRLREQQKTEKKIFFFRVSKPPDLD